MPLTLWQDWQTVGEVHVAQAGLHSAHWLLTELAYSPWLHVAAQVVSPI
jgi:hypothetical protein